MRDRLAWAALVIVLILAARLYWPATAVEYLLDDYFQQAVLAGEYPGPGAPFGLYAFVPPDREVVADHLARGSLPWWTVPHYRFAMIRPLASLSLAFDHAVAPGDPWFAHAHSVAWGLGFLVAVFAVVRRALGPAFAAVAVLLMALDAAMFMPVAWIANRCALQSATFGLVAILLHLRWRAPREGESNGWPWGVAELAAWSAAFLCGEYAIAGVAYVLAFELVAGEGGLRERGLAAAPALLVALPYVATHFGLGYGVYDTTVYRDPGADPRGFLQAALHRYPRLLGEAFTSIPADPLTFMRRFPGWGEPDPHALDWLIPHAVVLGMGGVLVAGLSLLAARPALQPEERRALSWMLLGTVAGIVPLLPAPAWSRLLLLPGLGAAAVLAAVAVASVRAWVPHLSEMEVPRPWRTRILGGVLVLGLAPGHLVGESRDGEDLITGLKSVALLGRAIYSSSSSLELGGKDVVMVTAPNIELGLHGFAAFVVTDVPRPASFHVLSFGEQAHFLRRTAPNKIMVLPMGEPLLVHPDERVFRSSRDPPALDQVMDAGVFRARIAALDPEGGARAIELTFDAPVDVDRYAFVRLGPMGLRRIPMPAVGQQILVPPPGTDRLVSRP